MTKSEDSLDFIFSATGPLKSSLKGYEERLGQQEMARQILDAYSNKEIALIEAGTGIGKSLAYLIPAILWAIKHKEKTVISTYTIALQEQLLSKDIPLLLKTLQVDLKAVLIKGMNNYLCLRKLEELQEESGETQSLKIWAERTKEGSRSDLSFPLSTGVWEKVGAESQACNHVHCPHYKQCFFFRARRQASEAQLLIVNHHLLFADLASKKRKEEERSIIPSFQRLVIDEAHHLEEVALDSLSRRYDRLTLVRLLGRIYSELHPERSRLMMIRQALQQPSASLIQRLEIVLPAEKRELIDKIEKGFTALEAFCRTTFTFNSKEQRWRLSEDLFEQKLWKEEVAAPFQEVSLCLSRFAQSLSALKRDLEAEEEKIESQAAELGAIAQRLEETAEGLREFFISTENEKRVRWVEFSEMQKGVSLVDARLDISTYVQEELFARLETACLCSATLTTKRTFDYLRSRLGVKTEQATTEKIYDSPFDYATQALLAVPTDLPDPADPRFLASAQEAIFQAISASGGGAFVLFTSYEMLKSSYQLLLPLAENQGWTLLRQGDLPRPVLIEKFKAGKKAVLFGTDSFWEGVDVAGEALRLVILAKLPFKVPSEPMVQALSTVLQNEGKDPFMDYLVPQAVMKFKQGFGRLIRTQTDRGAILCLDKRLITKSYGKFFLESLPPCRTLFATSDKVFEQMRGFWSVAGSNR